MARQLNGPGSSISETADHKISITSAKQYFSRTPKTKNVSSTEEKRLIKKSLGITISYLLG